MNTQEQLWLIVQDTITIIISNNLKDNTLAYQSLMIAISELVTSHI